MIITTLGFTQTVETLCELCGGTGFSDEVLEYRLDGKNIAEVLAMSADEASAPSPRDPPRRRSAA